MPTISIPVDSTLIGEMFLRSGIETDISQWVEHVLTDYLERTQDDPQWQDSYYEYKTKKSAAQEATLQYGDPKGGIHWAPLYLPNGTQIRMDYKNERYTAEVKFDQLAYQGKTYTPSQLARKIAAGTSRNAWRDLFIRRPSDPQWTLADELRHRRIT